MHKDINKRVNLLTLLNILTLIFVLALSFQNPTVVNPTTSVVGKNGRDGKDGIGQDGKNAVSYVQTVKQIEQLPPVNGINGDSCSATNDASGDVAFECGGTRAVLKQPLSGVDGTDGRTVQFQTNQDTCFVQYKYDDSRSWNDLVRDPDCEPQNG